MGECEELAVPVVSRASGWIRRPVIQRVSGLVVPVGDRLKGWALKQVERANAESGSGQVHGAGSAEPPPRLTRGAHEPPARTPSDGRICQISPQIIS